MPLILKTGFAVRPTEKNELGIGRRLAKLGVRLNNLLSPISISGSTSTENMFSPAANMEDVVITDDVILPAGYRDAWSLRLGGQQALGDAFTLRSGVFYEVSAIPGTTQSVSLIDGNKIGYGLGGGYRANDNWVFDVGITQSFLSPTEVKDSEVHQISSTP